MSTLTERCRAFRENVLAERESLRTEKAGLTERIEALLTERESLGSVIERLRSITYWAELSSGANVAAGEEVRYFAREYKCIKAHTKALLRSPLNGEYWEEI